MLYVLAGSLLAWPIAARNVVHVLAPHEPTPSARPGTPRAGPVACTGPAPATASSNPAAGASGSRTALVQRTFIVRFPCAPPVDRHQLDGRVPGDCRVPRARQPTTPPTRCK